MHTEKYFLILIKSNRNQIVFTNFWLIWIQTDVRLVPNQSENGKYNLISVRFNKISKKFLYVYASINGNATLGSVISHLLKFTGYVDSSVLKESSCKFYQEVWVMCPRFTERPAFLVVMRFQPLYSTPTGFFLEEKRKTLFPWRKKVNGKCECIESCTEFFFFEILLNQTEIRLYLPFSDWFGTKPTSENW